MRNNLINDLIEQIENEPWQRMFRRKLVGPRMFGWSHRLSHYGLINSRNPSLPEHLVWIKSLELKTKSYDPQRNLTADNGLSLGREILKWGGVEKWNLKKLPNVFTDVVASARSGSQIGKAPMNSGWTKIAAIFNYYDTYGHTSFQKHKPQIIWDSRVSLSVCYRLVKAAPRFGLTPTQLRSQFPNLGWSNGQGGNRAFLRQAVEGWFPNRYGKWDAHFAGGQVVLEISNFLNAGNYLPRLTKEQLACFDESEKKALQQWTPWLVACVLFMDGY